MNPHYTQVALRAGHRCEYCHAPEAVFNLPLEVEHIVPAARGGEDIAANWTLACRACNLYKATHVSGVGGSQRSGAGRQRALLISSWRLPVACTISASIVGIRSPHSMCCA